MYSKIYHYFKLIKNFNLIFQRLNIDKFKAFKIDLKNCYHNIIIVKI